TSALEIYTLSLHDALPISGGMVLGQGVAERLVDGLKNLNATDPLNEQEHDILRCIAAGFEDNSQIADKLGIDEGTIVRLLTNARSEEHTSELQSRGHLVCR